MKLVFISVIFVCFGCYAQDRVGVCWEKGLSWQQIKEKAKKEKKNIFVDCYTTWCGPCKMMDEKVYVKDSVARYMNKNFINVRVQMDRTQMDNSNVRDWYEEADNMRKFYKVLVFPTYLFFNVDGKIIHRDISYMPVDNFLNLAAKALNPKTQYYTLKTEYENGKKDFAVIRYLINKGGAYKDYKFVEDCKLDYLNYLSKQPDSVIYTKDNIFFIESTISDTKSPWVKFFVKNSKKINHLMGESGFCRRVVDSAINREFLNPFFTKFKKNDVEPNWDSLSNVIKRNMGTQYAIRNIEWRRSLWFLLKDDTLNSMKSFIQLIAMQGLDTSFQYSDVIINSFTYDYVYQNPELMRVHPEILISSVSMMEAVIKRADKVVNFYSYNDPSLYDAKMDADHTLRWKGAKIDTYACLLYKVGRIEEAIQWEQKALQIAQNMDDKSKIIEYKEVIESMKQGKL